MSEEQKTAEELIADAMNAADNAEDIAEDAAGAEREGFGRCGSLSP